MCKSQTQLNNYHFAFSIKTVMLQMVQLIKIADFQFAMEPMVAGKMELANHHNNLLKQKKAGFQ